MGSGNFVYRSHLVLSGLRVEYRHFPVKMCQFHNRTDSLVEVCHVVVWKQRKGRSVFVSVIDSESFLCKRNTDGSSVMILGLLRKILHHTVYDILLFEVEQVTETATEKSLENEHISERSQVWIIRKVKFVKTITLLYADIPRSSIYGFWHFKL